MKTVRYEYAVIDEQGVLADHIPTRAEARLYKQDWKGWDNKVRIIQRKYVMQSEKEVR